jgi:hypothetical protein
MNSNDAVNYSPVALFAYDRPDHLRRTVKSLLSDDLAIRTDLFIFSDAPKRRENLNGVSEVREYIGQLTGFRSIKIILRDQNFGLARSITEGVTSIVSEYESVIVLEDDLLIRPGFLSFMNGALEEYASEPKVYQISGYMYPGNYAAASEAFFLPMTSCWGWATWKRAWNSFNLNLDGFDELKKDANLSNKFNLQGSYDYIGMAEQQKAGKISSWGICWYYNVFMKDGLVLYPRSSFVQNIGVDSSGTHGGGHSTLQNELPKTKRFIDNIQFPINVSVDWSAFNEVVRILNIMAKKMHRNLFFMFISRLYKSVGFKSSI